MTEPGKFAPGLVGFPTPNTAADDGGYLLFCFNDQTWAQYILGACTALTFEYNWYKSGDLETWEAAEALRLIIQQAPYNLSPGEVGTPFWDDSSDVDDEAPEDDQRWYGEVSNPTAPADELTFVENALVWFFTGLVALATPELGFAPAILFHTIAPKFLLAQKRGDFGEIIRIVVDGKDMAEIDTTSYSPGDIIETPIVADPSIDDHTLLILSRLP